GDEVGADEDLFGPLDLQRLRQVVGRTLEVARWMGGPASVEGPAEAEGIRGGLWVRSFQPGTERPTPPRPKGPARARRRQMAREMTHRKSWHDRCFGGEPTPKGGVPRSYFNGGARVSCFRGSGVGDDPVRGERGTGVRPALPV